MKFGVLNFFEHPAGGKTEHRIFKEQLETLRAAEDLGFDYVWAPEHHFTEYGFCASPMLTLAAMASVTSAFGWAARWWCCPSTTLCAWRKRARCSI
jgi:alkanesulfonate monooxygenase SsuD/methylene tetrahydromethanopterin reductase-like flavin-dependent oxidoreductase (luciferase family)